MSKTKNTGLTGNTSTYPLDQAVIFTGQDAVLLRAAMEQIFNDSETAIFVPRYRYFSEQLDDYVPEAEVTEQDLKTGKIIKMLDPNATFKSSNIVQGYSADMISPTVRDAYLSIMHRFEMDARAGKTISIEDFQKLINKQVADGTDNAKANASGTEAAASTGESSVDESN